MTGWQLGLYSFGLLAAGFGLGITAVWWYARRVFRRQLQALPQQLLDTSSTGRPVPRPGDYLRGVEEKAREEGGL